MTGLQRLNRALLGTLTKTPEAAAIIADRLEELERDTRRLDHAERCWIHSKTQPGGVWGVVVKGAETSFGDTLRSALDESMAANTELTNSGDKQS
jgi:hypothetical protein